MHTCSRFFLAFLVSIAALCAARHAEAQQAPTGTIHGRVYDAQASNPRFLENAKVTLEGLNREALTDADGYYRFVGVPAGTVRVRVLFSGLDPQSAEVAVGPGATVQHNVGLNAYVVIHDDAGEKTIRLPAYEVTESREMANSMMAINEQRVAPNMKTVVGTEEYGLSPADDIGQFLKFVPGVTMDYSSGEARQASLGGVSYDYVPVTVNGFGMTSAPQNVTNRGVSLEHASLNNISRIEVVNSPTPESPGSALAGSVNLVARSAFERAKPVFTFSTFISMRDDVREFKKTPGPHDRPTYKVLPGFDFSYVKPVNSRFGFSISGGASKQYTSRDRVTNTWRGINAATNGGTLPDTTPDVPYLSDFLVRDSSMLRTRTSVALSVDYRLGDYGRLAFNFTRTTVDSEYDNWAMTYRVNRVLAGNFSSTHTHGFAGAGSIDISTEHRDRNNTTFMPTLVYRHEGPIWKAETGIGFSRSRDHTAATDAGYFSITSLRRTGLTISFDEIGRLGPQQISVRDAVGNPVNPHDINTYSINQVQQGTTQGRDTKRSAFGSVRRDFDGFRIPFRLKAGVEVSQHSRDNLAYVKDANGREVTDIFTFVGADGVASSSPLAGDDDAAPWHWEQVAGRRGAFGFPPVPAVSPIDLLEAYRTNPGWFATENAVTRYNRIVGNSKYAEETIYAAYLRGDVSLFNSRLKIVGGVRGEQTNIDARGPLTDLTLNFQRDANGNIVLGGNGQPLVIETDPLLARQRVHIARGAHVQKEYLRWFPSVNAAFGVRDDLVLRAARYHSVGRPSFNQYAGGISRPNTEAAPSTTNRFVVNNAGIKAWSGATTMLALEYYFPRTGMVSVSGFRRDIENFFGNIVQPVTPEFLELYGLDTSGLYDGYSVSTQYNIPGKVRMEGITLNYKQALTFLPQWGRGLSVFANGTRQRATGAHTSNFTFSPKFGSAGISLNRPKYSVQVSMNFRGEQYDTNLSGRSVAGNTVRQSADMRYLDVSAQYMIWRRVALFAKFSNLADQGLEIEAFNPQTPAHARLQQVERYGSLWSFGIKGEF